MLTGNTKYSKEYCQFILDRRDSGFIVVDFVEGLTARENKIIIQCKNKNHKTREISAFSLNQSKFQCLECVKENKITEIKEFTENNGYKFIDFEFFEYGNRYVVHFSDGTYKYRSNWSNLKSGKKPLLVDPSNPYSSENVEVYIKKNYTSYEFISAKYMNNELKILCKCPKEECGEIFDVKFHEIRNGKGCPYCVGARVGNSNSFLLNCPEAAKEWDYDKNECIDINSVVINSGKYAWFICDKCGHSWKTQIRIKSRCGCPNCAIINRRGELNSRWKGGISEIYYYLRMAVEPWKFDTSDFYGGKCVISNTSKDKIIHHLNVPFATIVEECFDELKIDKRKTIGEYNNREIKDLSELCLKKHYEYGLGIVLNNDLHDEFHKIYGTTNNTKEQFLEFAKSNGKNIKL